MHVCVVALRVGAATHSAGDQPMQALPSSPQTTKTKKSSGHQKDEAATMHALWINTLKVSVVGMWWWWELAEEGA